MNITKNSGNAQMSPNRHIAYLLSVVLMVAVALPSAASGNYRKQLKVLDDAIRNQAKYHEAAEEKIRGLLTEMKAASSDSMKWVLADKLYKEYHHYSLDSMAKYQREMELHAVTQEQKTLSLCAKIRVLLTHNEADMADEVLKSILPDELPNRRVRLDYLRCRILVNSSLADEASGEAERNRYLEIVRQERLAYMQFDSTSFYSKRLMSMFYRDNGNVKKALEILLDLYPRQKDEHNKASVAYNISKLYEMAGDKDSRFTWLVRSAVHDFQNAERAYMSLYEIAVILYEHGEYAKAEQYINKNLMDVMAGGYSNRFYNSGKAKLIIADAAGNAARNRVRWLAAVTGVIMLLLISILMLLRREVRLRKQLKLTNKELLDANKIKNSYVFRYMELSVGYIDRIAETRTEIRSIAKNEGLEAVMRNLKSPSVMYREYDAFYRIFDETFLGLYPDFVTKVNALLQEEGRFNVEPGVLTTELLVLAAIRIGITESGKIAKFLKCSPNTVYTYRTKLKRLALCPKDDFETEIARI